MYYEDTSEMYGLETETWNCEPILIFVKMKYRLFYGEKLVKFVNCALASWLVDGMCGILASFCDAVQLILYHI